MLAIQSFTLSGQARFNTEGPTDSEKRSQSGQITRNAF
jgi:hypothetical protein